MAPTKIIVQNISGNILDKKTTGKLCTLKVNIHKIMPNIIILTETRHLPEFNGKGIFKKLRVQVLGVGQRGFWCLKKRN